MNCPKLLQPFIGLALAVLVLVGCSLTNTPPVTPVQIDLELQVIIQVASQVFQESKVLGGPSITVRGPAYSFFCGAAAGHSSGAKITRFPSQTEAQAAFNQAYEASQEFHGCPASQTQYDENTEPGAIAMRHSSHVWQADRWLIEVSAFGDTGIQIAGVLRVSEQLYQAALASGLPVGC
jgi:hypothetical protein